LSLAPDGEVITEEGDVDGILETWQAFSNLGTRRYEQASLINSHLGFTGTISTVLQTSVFAITIKVDIETDTQGKTKVERRTWIDEDTGEIVRVQEWTWSDLRDDDGNIVGRTRTTSEDYIYDDREVTETTTETYNNAGKLTGKKGEVKDKETGETVETIEDTYEYDEQTGKLIKTTGRKVDDDGVTVVEEGQSSEGLPGDRKVTHTSKDGKVTVDETKYTHGDDNGSTCTNYKGDNKGNGKKTTISYDAHRRPTSVKVEETTEPKDINDPASTTVLEEEYEYDEDGRLIRIKRTIPKKEDIDIYYDDDGNPVEIERTDNDPDDGEDRNGSVILDEDGNVIEKEGNTNGLISSLDDCPTEPQPASNTIVDFSAFGPMQFDVVVGEDGVVPVTGGMTLQGTPGMGIDTELDLFIVVLEGQPGEGVHVQIPEGGPLRWWIPNASVTAQGVISLDGPDGDPQSVHTDGLGNLDLTFDGTQKGVTINIDSNLNPVDAAVVIFSGSPDDSIEIPFTIPQTTDPLDVDLLFDQFSIRGSGAADNAGAFVLFLGSGGGMDGPVDLQLDSLGTITHAPHAEPPKGKGQ